MVVVVVRWVGRLWRWGVVEVAHSCFGGSMGVKISKWKVRFARTVAEGGRWRRRRQDGGEDVLLDAKVGGQVLPPLLLLLLLH